MLTALVRAVSPAIARCELTHLERQPIEYERAVDQHDAYCAMLERLGARVVRLPAEPELPDSVFVEDPALLLDELAVILPLGVESRRPEAALLAKTLSAYRPLEYVMLPGTIDGGDVLRVGRALFVGLTRRTNEEGIRQLRAIVARHGYEVTAVPVRGCLHLKSAATWIGGKTLLANRARFDTAAFAGFDWVDVDEREPRAANALALGSKVIFPASFPRTRERLEARGCRVETLDISELQKAEAGLTCSSLLFDT